MRPPVSDGPRNSMNRIEGSSTSPIPSNGSSKRITEPSSGKKKSKRVDSFREEENVIKIEESLVLSSYYIYFPLMFLKLLKFV